MEEFGLDLEMKRGDAMMASTKTELTSKAIQLFKLKNSDIVEASDFKAHPWARVNCLLRLELGMDQKDWGGGRPCWLSRCTEARESTRTDYQHALEPSTMHFV